MPETAPKVLIVDDALFMRMMLRDILSKNGFEVVGEAEDGFEAVEQYKALKPDLVTMDIVMPQMDGITAVKNILASDPDAVIVMCSAMGQQALILEALEAGARDFITKPFSPNRVVETVRRILKLDGGA